MRLLPAKSWRFLLFSAILCGTNLSAQTATSGGLTGVITDQTDAVVPNADIEIKDNSKGTVRSTKTDREGVYRLFFLAPGEYTVTSSAPGFEVTRRTIPVSVGQTTLVDLTLKVGTANTTVAVTTDAPTLQTQNADGSTVFNAQQIANLPNPGKTRLSARAQMRPQRRRGITIPSHTAGHQRPREEWVEIPVPALVTEETFARAQELLYQNKIRSRRRTIAPSVVQGLVGCAKCGYALSRTSTQTSARKIHYYKCIGSDSWRKLGGPVCDNNRFIRQELLDQIDASTRRVSANPVAGCKEW